MNRRELDYVVCLIDNFSLEVQKINGKIEQEQYRYPEVEILKSIPGIDTYSALLVIAEVADFGRFPTPYQLCSYAGLVPSTHQSSNICYNGRITKQGSKWLRWILVQCAHASVKTRTSHRLKRFFLRIARRKGEKKAIVATARKMMIIIWHLLDKNCYYEAGVKFGLQAP
jgi:transposase